MTSCLNKLPKRDEIDSKYRWKLEDIYSSDDAWEADFIEAGRLAEKAGEFRGCISQSPEKMLECFTLRDRLAALVDKLFAYARMRRDEDNSNPVYQALTDRATALSAKASSAVSFIIPDIIAMDEGKLKEFLNSNQQLKIYTRHIEEVLRQKAHILSDKEEEILALSAEMAQAADEIFTMLNNADIKFPFIKDENGNEVELTKGRYIKFLESHDRRVRKDAFHALYSTYAKISNTLAASLSGSLKKDKFYAQVRKYPSTIEASLDDDNVSVDVYDNLIKTVNKNLPLLHRYLRLRKKALKLDRLHMYDLYVPMVEEYNKTISYEDALALVSLGLGPLGDEYLNDLNHAFKSGWIDVYENEGKTCGAYSWGTYLSHPFVLLNYQGTINDVFTLAHEMGHALHSYYTNKTQPYIYSGYRIFVAEVASTVNETLLNRYMLDVSTDKKEKAYLLNHYLEQFRGTLFRQTMFAEF
jgi:oligoendopeptidase F